MPAEVYYNFAGHAHYPTLNDNTERFGSVLTEALKEEYQNIIRIVQIKDVANPTKEDIDYSKIEGIPEDKVSDDIKRPDPYVIYSPSEPDFEENVIFSVRDEIKENEIASCDWDFGDGNLETSDNNRCEISHQYTSYTGFLCEDFKVKATVKYKDSTQRITQEKTIRVCPRYELKLPLPIIPFSIFGEQITSENTPQSTILTKVASEGKPVGIVNIHFEQASSDIDLTNLVADIDLSARKSVLHMPDWPDVIEQEKALFIPSTGIGTIYLCPHATSLYEVTPQCNDIEILDIGESKDNLFVDTTTYNNQNYYLVYGVKGTGGGEALKTQLTYEGDLIGQYSDEVNLKAILTDKNGGPLIGKTIDFVLGGQTATAATDENGIATTTMELLQIPGNYTLETKFTGEGDYLPSSDSKSFEIQKEKIVITISGKEGFTFEDIVLEAKVLDEGGQVLIDGPYEVEFKINDKITGKAQIDEAGNATTSWNINLIPKELTEIYPIVVSFAENECYLSIEGQADFTLKSAKWLKQDAINELESSKTGDKTTDWTIGQIIKYIQNSLDNDLWLDASHLLFFQKGCFDSEIMKFSPDGINFDKMFELEPQKMELEMKKGFKGKCFSLKLGIKVFYSEYAATKLLLQGLNNSSKIPEGLKNVFKKTITKLVKADQLLAKISLSDAKDVLIQNQKLKKIIELQIKKAEEELKKAEQELVKNKPDRAILRFVKAWLNSQLTIKSNSL